MRQDENHYATTGRVKSKERRQKTGHNYAKPNHPTSNAIRKLDDDNVYHELEEPEGNNSTSNNITLMENEYHELEGPGDGSGTCKNVQLVDNEYRELEGKGDSCQDAREMDGEYYILESPTAEREEGEEQG